jgi:1-acyl-sn-glycerol-3-phosphate acyltransferase
MSRRRVSVAYRVVMAVATPFVRWWGRLEVEGAEVLAPTGGILMMANHDSHWDPLVVGLAARGVQVRALAKASLWKNPVVARVLDGMGQIPIERGRSDTAALSAAIERLQAGDCVGVFPEGTVSRGKQLRALSGAGRLATAAPGVQVVAVSITGAVDVVRFPKRPRLRVRFFLPAGGQPHEGESPIALTKRVMSEVRAEAPPVAAGRHPEAAAVEG